MKKIVLFYPKVSEVEILKSAPLSLLSIARLLPKEEYNIKIIDESYGEDYISRALREVEGAICLGVSCMTGYQIKDAIEISKLVKKRYSKIPIIWGGWHPSLLPEQTLREPYIDIIVTGMGEITFPELIKALEKKESLHKINGILFKQGSKIIKTPPRPFEDLNKLPPIPYNLLEIEKYILKVEPGEDEITGRGINYHTSYGCPYACAFCAAYSVYKRKWNALTAERVLDEINHLVKTYNLDWIGINDNNFFVDEKRAAAICKGIIDMNLNVKLGPTSGRAKTLANYSLETWEAMSKSITSILIGAESASQETLKAINKESEIEDTIRFAKLCKKYNIKAVYSLMVGFPFLDTKKKLKDEFKQMIRFIKKIKKLIKRACL